MAITNRAAWSKNDHSLRIGRQKYLDSDNSVRADEAKALTTTRHYVRKGRPAYVNDVNGGRRS